MGAVSGAITNAQGTFTNQATINIGSIASVGYYGIQNSAISIFNNNINGIINIDRTVSTGFEAGGSVSNDGTINIGAVASVGPYGFSCGSGFTNHINGILNIDRSTEIGFSTGATINDGLINIGSISSVGIWGLNLSNANPEIFTNNPTGVININRTNEYGIESYDLAQILNKGIITIGEIVPLTDLIHQASINNLPGGILKGTGKITGSAFGTGLGDNGGTLSPGYSPGTMTFTQSQTFSSGIIDIEILAGTPVTFDKIIVNGTATLGGTLNITETGSVATGSYIIFSATSISGTFATVNIPDCYTLEYGATTVSLKKGVSKIWDGTVNNWNQPNHWNPYGVPCPLDDVIINAGECSLNINPDMKSLTINGGTLKKVDAATYSINVKTTVAGAGKINVFAGTLDMNDTLDNNGTIQGFANIDLLGATVIGGYGRWAPGNSTGVLDAKGTYNNEVIKMEIGGNGGGIGTVELDKLNVSQTMVIGGNLDLLWLGGSVPIGNRVLMECAGGSGCRTGTFASIAFPAQCNGNCNIIYTPTEVRLENTQPIEFIGTCTWLGGTGNWSTVAKWSCNDVPNFNDDVVINSGTVTVDNPTTCKTMVLGGGASLSGNKTLTISDGFTWTGGQISIDNEVSVGTAAISGPVSLDNCNLILAQGGVLNNATLIIKDEATLTVPLNKNLDFNYSSNIAINTIGPATIINNGTINKLGNGNLDLFPGFQNNGVLKINSGALNFQNSLTNNNTIKGIGVIGLSNANIFKMGKIAPGNSPGTINVTGNYPNQKLIIEITQNNGVEIDKLIATGQLQLKDTLIIEHLGGSIPNGSYEFMTCPLGTNCRKNTFEIISYPAFCGGGCSLEYNESNVKLVYEQGLPIELASFTGRLINKEIELDWTTLSEQNAASFDIMRSANGNEWVYLGEVSANGTTSAQHDYSFIDTDPVSGENYYRLKQHDLDGTIYYSKVIRIQTPIKKAWKLYPNPAQDMLEVRFSNKEDGYLQIFDATGRLVLKQKIEAEKIATIDLSPLASGLYWVQMTGFKTEMVVKH